MTALMTNSASSPSHQGGADSCCCCSGAATCGQHLYLLPQPQGSLPTDPPTCPFAIPSAAFRRAPAQRLAADEERELFHELARLRRQLAERVPSTDAADRRQRLELMRASCRACSIRRYLGQTFFPLAVSVARGFAKQYQDIDDLVGQACITLMRALDLYDVERGHRFSTYATRAIRTELARFILRGRRRVDRSIDVDLLNIHPAAVFRQRHPGWATYCALEGLLDDLDTREADIVRSRFGLNDHPGCETLQAVADRLGISRERVRQLEQLALAKLRQLAEQDERVELFAATGA